MKDFSAVYVQIAGITRNKNQRLLHTMNWKPKCHLSILYIRRGIRQTFRCKDRQNGHNMTKGIFISITLIHAFLEHKYPAFWWLWLRCRCEGRPSTIRRSFYQSENKANYLAFVFHFTPIAVRYHNRADQIHVQKHITCAESDGLSTTPPACSNAQAHCVSNSNEPHDRSTEKIILCVRGGNYWHDFVHARDDIAAVIFSHCAMCNRYCSNCNLALICHCFGFFFLYVILDCMRCECDILRVGGVSYQQWICSGNVKCHENGRFTMRIRINNRHWWCIQCWRRYHNGRDEVSHCLPCEVPWLFCWPTE